MRGEGQNLTRTTVNTSASAQLRYALYPLLGTLSLPVLWLGQHGRSAVQTPAEIPSFVLLRPPQSKGSGLTEYKSNKSYSNCKHTCKL